MIVGWIRWAVNNKDDACSYDELTRWPDDPILVVPFSQLHLAAEHAVDEHKIGHGEHRG